MATQGREEEDVFPGRVTVAGRGVKYGNGGGGGGGVARSGGYRDPQGTAFVLTSPRRPSGLVGSLRTC